MPPKLLPLLPLADWRPTRDTLHGYVQVLGPYAPRWPRAKSRPTTIACASPPPA